MPSTIKKNLKSTVENIRIINYRRVHKYRSDRILGAREYKTFKQLDERARKGGVCARVPRKSFLIQ